MSGLKYYFKFGLALGILGLVVGQGCPLVLPNGNSSGISLYNNTTDRTNNNASFIGSEACKLCHPDIAKLHLLHGHAYKLNPISGSAPTYPAEATRSVVPNPPDGKTWDDIAYVIGGYIRKARFIDLDGFVLTDGVDGVNTQWNLAFPPNGNVAGWHSYQTGQVEPKPYDFSCFQCHTTGPMPQDANNPMFQDNRPGLIGTWAEEGVQCEACHGPGSKHVPNTEARDLYVDLNAVTCKECHNRPFNSTDGVIRASSGFIRHHEQAPEILASSGHSEFACTVCHDPHAGTNYDRDNAIRNECESCHSDQNMAFHQDKVFVNGDYVEYLDCESCHMPYATKSAAIAPAGEEFAGDGRIGDTKTHIFSINTNPVDYTAMFTSDLSAVNKDADGRASVTVDFVCMRCHNDVGNAFKLTVKSASDIALLLHGN
ncbi:MAG: multiheme c-type cytochrome [Planctomycetota bacterium]|jgi:nitrate reductase cytochrome c-type subunit